MEQTYKIVPRSEWPETIPSDWIVTDEQSGAMVLRPYTPSEQQAPVREGVSKVIINFCKGESLGGRCAYGKAGNSCNRDCEVASAPASPDRGEVDRVRLRLLIDKGIAKFRQSDECLSTEENDKLIDEVFNIQSASSEQRVEGERTFTLEEAIQIYKDAQILEGKHQTGNGKFIGSKEFFKSQFNIDL